MPKNSAPDVLPTSSADANLHVNEDAWLNATSSEVAWLQKSWLWTLLCLAAALPLVYPTMPPLTDLGGHLGRFAVQVDAGKSADLRQWYSFHWALIPNLGCDLLMQLLAPEMGLEPALKAIVIAIPVIQTAGFLLLARSVHGRVTPLTLFALPLAYGYPFQFGFINFTLCVALATCALALWISMGGRDRITIRWALFVPIACMLWLCHLVGWAVFCIFAASIELTKLRENGQGLRQAVYRCILPLSCLVAPLIISAVWPSVSSGHGVTKDFFKPHLKLYYLAMVLRDRWMLWDLASVLVLASLIGWGFRSPRFIKHSGLALGVGVLAICYLIMPGTIFGSHLADMRLAPILFAVEIIALDLAPGSGRRLAAVLAVAGIIFTGARFAANAASLALFDRQFNQDLSLLNQIPRGATLINIAVESCHQTILPWQRERRLHLGGYAIARRHDFSNDEWIIPGAQLLSVHNPAAGAFTQDDSEMAQQPDCKPKHDFRRQEALVPHVMQYLWILSDGFAHPIPGWKPLIRSNDSVIYTSSEKTLGLSLPKVGNNISHHRI